MLIEDELQFRLRTIHGQPIPEGNYQIDLALSGDYNIDELIIFLVSISEENVVKAKKSEEGFSVEVDTRIGKSIKISGDKYLFIKGIKLTRL